MTYSQPDNGVFLHHYLTIKNTLTELVRGEQEQAMREFYGLLLHTSSTQAGFEYAIRPWESRDFEGNLSPHGWFAAEYRNLLRNMMVREDGESLHLLSAVSPEWIGKGKTIRVTAAPTYFGKLDFTCETPMDDSAVLRIQSHWSRAPKTLVLHLPWFVEGASATADGKPVKVMSGAIQLPADTREVQISWHRRTDVHMNYERTVESYKTEYAKRYERLLETGEMSSGPDTWRVPD